MGAGNCGTVLFHRLNAAGIAVTAFIDNYGSIHGKQYCDIPIYTSKELSSRLQQDSHYICIVALLDILSFEQIKETLEQDLSEQVQVYFFTQFRSFRPVFGIDKKPEFSAYFGEDVMGAVR